MLALREEGLVRSRLIRRELARGHLLLSRVSRLALAEAGLLSVRSETALGSGGALCYHALLHLGLPHLLHFVEHARLVRLVQSELGGAGVLRVRALEGLDPVGASERLRTRLGLAEAFVRQRRPAAV